MNDITTKIYSNSPGIYCIRNVTNDKRYIGSTKSMYKRLIHHRHELNTNTHGNPHLQHAFDKYGIDKFKIEILEYCEDIYTLWKREEYYCNQYEDLYNLKTIEQTSFGHKRVTSEETKRKLSASHKGKIPKNLKDIQQQNRRKINKIVDNKIVEIFDSCVDAAKSLNMKPNMFHHYIGKILKRKKSKYFPKNTSYQYA